MQSSQSPQGLRTPGRHWSLVALGGLLPFPLKEAAAPAAQEDHKSACCCHGCLPASVDCTHPQGRPPSTMRCAYGGSGQCLQGKPKETATLLQTLSSNGCRQGRAQAGVFERMKKGSFLVLTPQPAIFLYTEPRLGILKAALFAP